MNPVLGTIVEFEPIVSQVPRKVPCARIDTVQVKTNNKKCRTHKMWVHPVIWECTRETDRQCIERLKLKLKNTLNYHNFVCSNSFWEVSLFKCIIREIYDLKLLQIKDEHYRLMPGRQLNILVKNNYSLEFDTKCPLSHKMPSE